MSAWVAGAIVGSSVINGIIQHNAGKDAAGAQNDASQAGIAATQKQFEQMQQVLNPYVQAGYQALGYKPIENQWSASGSDSPGTPDWVNDLQKSGNEGAQDSSTMQMGGTPIQGLGKASGTDWDRLYLDGKTTAGNYFANTGKKPPVSFDPDFKPLTGRIPAKPYTGPDALPGGEMPLHVKYGTTPDMISDYEYSSQGAEGETRPAGPENLFNAEAAGWDTRMDPVTGVATDEYKSAVDDGLVPNTLDLKSGATQTEIDYAVNNWKETLAEKGKSPEAIDSIVSNYLQTGQGLTYDNFDTAGTTDATGNVVDGPATSPTPADAGSSGVPLGMYSKQDTRDDPSTLAYYQNLAGGGAQAVTDLAGATGGALDIMQGYAGSGDPGLSNLQGYVGTGAAGDMQNLSAAGQSELANLQKGTNIDASRGQVAGYGQAGAQELGNLRDYAGMTRPSLTAMQQYGQAGAPGMERLEKYGAAGDPGFDVLESATAGAVPGMERLEGYGQAGIAGMDVLSQAASGAGAGMDRLGQYGQAGTEGLGALGRYGTAGGAGLSAMEQYAGGGAPAFDMMQALAGTKGPEAYQMAIDQVRNSPEMAAQVQQAEEAIMQNAAATGGLRGGNVQKSLMTARPEILSNLINQKYNRLSGISGQGADAARYLASQGADTSKYLAGAGMGASQYQAGQGTDAARYLTGTGVDTSKYLTGQGTDAARYLAGTGVGTSQYLASQGADASKYLTGSGLDTSRYLTGTGFDASKYLTGTGIDTSRYLTGTGADASRYMTGADIDTSRYLSGQGADAARYLTGAGGNAAQYLTGTGQTATGQVANLGQASAAGVGAAGMQTGQNIANLLGQAGAAQAGSALATGNAWGQGVNTLGQLGMMKLAGAF